MMHTSSSPTPATFADDVQRALHHWHSRPTDEPPLHDLNLVWQEIGAAGGDIHRAVNALLYRGLTAMALRFPREAELLEWRYLDGQTVSYVANRRNIAESTVFAQQRRAVQLLSDALWAMEQESVAAKVARLDALLDVPVSDQVIGQEAAIAQLVELAGRATAPWLIAVEGIGGIGKTTLTDAAVRRLVRLPTVHAVAWVSAQPAVLDFGGAIRKREQAALSTDAIVLELLRQVAPEQALQLGPDLKRATAALAAALQQTPHLVVVDNLETLDDLEALLPTLQTLANPSKIIVTTRKTVHSVSGIYHVPVAELDAEAAFALLRLEATRNNLPELVASDDAMLWPVYNAVGGNPLALRLVVGQLHVYGLDDILADLPAARGDSVENLYTFIYRRAWDSLDETSRCVLLAMPLVQLQGEELAFIQRVSGLAERELKRGLDGLARLNLVNVMGTLAQRRYGIHSLTRTFLQEQVARWQ